MNLDWILSPITCYAAIALALAACVAVFVSTKTEVWRLRQSASASEQALRQKIEQMEAAVSHMERQRQEAPVETPVRTPTLRPSLNLTRRTQALRMRRRGESVESIAAALSTPRNEIELLLKVYEMVEYRRQLKAPAEPAL
jgi:transcriptional regulator